MNKQNQIQWFQWAVGACDAFTGILLVLAPVWTLKLMGMKEIPVPADTMSFVGIFVMAVGLSYFLTKKDDLIGWEMQWKLTALVRLCVAAFLSWKLLAGGWEMPWITVLLTDLIVGGIQLTGLKREWLDKS